MPSLKLVFSANLQETLGIRWYEGALVDAIPMVPDRLSYSEMALPEFNYPSAWTENFDAYFHNRDKVLAQIVNYMENFTDLQVLMPAQNICTQNQSQPRTQRTFLSCYNSTPDCTLMPCVPLCIC